MRHPTWRVRVASITAALALLLSGGLLMDVSAASAATSPGTSCIPGTTVCSSNSVFQLALQQAIDVHNGGTLPGTGVSDLIEYSLVLALIAIQSSSSWIRHSAKASKMRGGGWPQAITGAQPVAPAGLSDSGG
jgi:hypothetical protein